MVVVGAAKSSIVQIHSAAIGSASMCGTSACTANVCSPAMRPLASKSSSSVYVFCDSQATGTEPSMEHWKTTSGVVDENANVGVRSSVRSAGYTSIVVVGAVMTPISQLYEAGVASRLPSAPRARTKNSCSPIGRPVYVCPELHGSKPRSLSSEHSNVAPGWFAWKVNVADVASVSGAGPVRIVDSGAGVTC